MSKTYDRVVALQTQIRALRDALKPFLELESDVIKYGALSRRRAQEYQAHIENARTVLQNITL